MRQSHRTSGRGTESRAGELDLSVAAQLKGRLDAAAMEDIDVLICLERCDFIDSTGIAAIVSAQKVMASRGQRLSGL